MRKIIGFLLCFCLTIFTSVSMVKAGPVEEIAKAANDFGQPISENGIDILVGATNPGSRPDPWQNVSAEFDTSDPLLALAKKLRAGSYSRLTVPGDVYIASGLLMKVDHAGSIGLDGMRLNGEQIEDGCYLVIEEAVLITSDGEEVFSPLELVEVIPLAAGAPIIRSCSTTCPGSTLSSACCFSKDGGVRCTCKSTNQIANEGCDLGGGQGSTGCSVTMEVPIESLPGGDPPEFEAPISDDGGPVKNR